ncbi:hypothetical protein [Stenotrophomonas maltophilia]|uniref:hypothetical protein n=1 Tax=Stenotrophomonas maltophilia TaxID=40324 RepID=UPI001FA6F65E|nr:hypothetical protein [Stenotrophomonas maltophilia]
MTTDNKTLPVFRFARYVNGVRMAEGVTIEKANNLPDAMRTAAKLATIGHGGDVPVLVHEPATLADVQSGGRVRLGDQAERARFEAWHCEKFKTRCLTGAPTRDMHNGVYAENYGPAEQQERWELWQAALSAHTSPGGQGDAPEHCAECRHTTFEAHPDGHICVHCKLIVATRQTVGEHGEGDEFLAGICVALQCVTAQDSGVLWAEIVRAVGVDDLLQYATFIEPAEWDLAGFSKYASTELHRRKPRSKASKQAKRPPAQAVDLGQIIEQIAQQWDGCSYDAVGETIDVGQAIRTAGKRLADSQAVGNG